MGCFGECLGAVLVRIFGLFGECLGAVLVSILH